MTKYLITGTSSGIGCEMVKKLIGNNCLVWGVARRSELNEALKNSLPKPQSFSFSTLDLSLPNSWVKIVHQLQKVNFIPDVIVFNAAVLECDYKQLAIDMESTRRIFEINFFSILNGFNQLSKIVKHNATFVFIGSTSAFKGSGEEGIGYSGSKAAITIAFESLLQRFQKQFNFKLIHLGPINTPMVPFSKNIMFLRKPDQAAQYIIDSINSKNHLFYFPVLPFIIIKFIKILPASIYLFALEYINSLHKKYRST